MTINALADNDCVIDDDPQYEDETHNSESRNVDVSRRQHGNGAHKRHRDTDGYPHGELEF